MAEDEEFFEDEDYDADPGISGVKAASATVFKELDERTAAADAELLEMKNRILEDRGNLDRPMLWCKWRLPTGKYNDSPTNRLLEDMANGIIEATGVKFPVDRCAFVTLNEPIDFGGKPHMIGFIAIAPRSSKKDTSGQFDRARSKANHRELRALDTALFHVLRVKKSYQRLPKMPSFVEGLHLSFTAVNAVSETLAFFIEGLPPKLVLDDSMTDDPATTRHLTMDLFMGMREAYRLAHRHGSLTDAGFNINDPYTLGGLMGIKQVRTNGKPRLFGVCIASGDARAEKLRQAVEQLCVHEGKRIWICGGKLAVILHAAGKGIRVDHKGIADRSDAKIYSKKISITKNIRLHPMAIGSRQILTKIAGTIQDCCGIVPHLGQGRNALTFTVLRQYDADAALSTSALERQIIANNMKQLDLTPIAAAHDGVHPAVTSPNFTPTKRGGGYGQGSSARKTPNYPTNGGRKQNHGNYRKRAAASPSSINRLLGAAHTRKHALLNPKGGMSLAGIFDGHYDDWHIRELNECVSFNDHRGFDTEGEAMEYFRLRYPHVHSMADIRFMNENAPLEASNLNNPCLHMR